MLATQDVQASSAGEAAGEELTQLLHQVDLLLVRASQAASRFAKTNEYDRQGYASPIDWVRFNCHFPLGKLPDGRVLVTMSGGRPLCASRSRSVRGLRG